MADGVPSGIRAAAMAAMLGGLIALGACGTTSGTPTVEAGIPAPVSTAVTSPAATSPAPMSPPFTAVTSSTVSPSGATPTTSTAPTSGTSSAPVAPSTDHPERTEPTEPTDPSASPASVTTSSPPPSSPTATSPPPASTGPLPGVGLGGVNMPDCRSAKPPVLLLHGSFSTVAGNFRALAPALIADGRCVYGIDYGDEGTGPVKDSASQVAAFVGRLLARTGAPRIDVVGYSQGGLVLRTALRLDGIADDVRVAVLIAPSFHGTTSPLATLVPSAMCAACADQAAGSALLRQLDAGGDLDGAVRYAVLSTRNDVVVTPVDSQVPQGPADRVRSLIVEDACPAAHTDHLSLPALPGLPSWVVAALDTDGRPPASALTCG